MEPNKVHRTVLYRSASKNLSKESRKILLKSLKELAEIGKIMYWNFPLNSAFIWMDTPQGFFFWERLWFEGESNANR